MKNDYEVYLLCDDYDPEEDPSQCHLCESPAIEVLDKVPLCVKHKRIHLEIKGRHKHGRRN